MKKMELCLPSVLGSEKIALEKAEKLARDIGFSDARIEDLRTVLAEACINAIEHGNKFSPERNVEVILRVSGSSLHIVIRDMGAGLVDAPERKLSRDDIPSRRGWGIFLIKKLVNELTFASGPDGAHEMRIIIHEAGLAGDPEQS